MSCKAGSIIARASSGSRPSISAVEPLRSANSAVIVLRSPSGVPRASSAACSARMRSARCGGVHCPGSCLSLSHPHQHFAALVTGHSLPFDEFLLEGVELVVIQGKFQLEGAIGEPPFALQEVAGLIKNLGEFH